VLLLALATSHAHAKDKIVWGWAEFAPYSIPHGPEKGQGLLDEARDLVVERLTAYEHEDASATIPRISTEIESGKNWCWFGPYKTPVRDKFSLFSIPVAIELPHRIIINEASLPRFQAMGKLSLEEILAEGKLTGLFTRERSYGAAIDALLQRHPPSKAQWHSSMTQPLLMILAERVDYTVEYPLVANYNFKKFGQTGKLAGLPFKEMSRYEFRRVMCPKNAWGEKVIADVNAILRAERPGARYRKIAEKWHDEDGAKQIRQLYDPVFLKSE
jgi:polar amino acid transport system substrate-binding protein